MAGTESSPTTIIPSQKSWRSPTHVIARCLKLRQKAQYISRVSISLRTSVIVFLLYSRNGDQVMISLATYISEAVGFGDGRRNRKT